MLQVVWAITFIGVIILGIIAGRKVKNIQEWALGGRNLTWIDVGCILAAFQMGGTTIIGVAQNGFKIGYAGAWYSITGTIAMLCMLLVVKPLRRRTNGDSLMSFMSDRYSPAVAKFYSYSYLLMGFFYIPIQLFTLCTVIQLVIPNSSLAVAAVIGLVLAVSYSALSGIEGAKVVGKLTCLFAYIFIAVGTFLIVSKAGGWADIKAVAPADHFSMANMPLNTIIGWIISSICGFMTMQAALQPTLAAKDDSHAVKGAIAGAIFSLPMGFLTATIGIVACVKLPEIDSSAAFVETVNTFLPSWLTGTILGMVALIIATTLSAQVLAVGTIMKNIYVNEINKNAEPKKVLAVSRILTFVFAMLSMIPIFAISKSTLSNVFMVVVTCGTAPMTFSVVCGLFWKKATKQGALWSMIVGIVVGIAWIVAGLNGKLNVCFPILITSFLVGYIVSKATNKEIPNVTVQ